ncbi:hypothetical protein HDU87_006311 [Geranomyces variabilis]|uniref:JmjC domain-containing protein n=1 Tax=Geranomyces variabilis TaxID=109894 RepID=A0AAD5TH96_9FUNG|nr:hypothetical protein HDU87_006311 [Geranomyces variabilis]
MLRSLPSSTVPAPPPLPDETIDELLARLAANGTAGPFKAVTTIDALTASEAEVLAAVENALSKGVPIVIQNTLKAWFHRSNSKPSGADSDAALFSLGWLRAHASDEPVQLRNVLNGEDVESSMGGFLDYLAKKTPAERRAENNTLYGKDISCPPAWSERAMKCLPEFFKYKGKNDLISLLPAELQPENLMIYVGNEGTLTPGHTDLCGSVGHNLMVYTGDGARAIWFLAESAALSQVSRFWKAQGQSIYGDDYFASVDVLQTAPFDVFVIEQKLGDFVIVPPETAHQVYNKGGINMKLSWNRVTVDSLQRCVERVLSEYRIHMRPEIYRIKTLVHHTVKHMTTRAGPWSADSDLSSRLKFMKDFRSVITSFATIVRDEWIEGEPDRSFLPTPWPDVGQPHMRICDFCRADIWNRGFNCKICASASKSRPLPAENAYAGVQASSLASTSQQASPTTALGSGLDAKTASPPSTPIIKPTRPHDLSEVGEDEFDVCLQCYAQGRSCPHETSMNFHEYVSMRVLSKQLTVAVNAYNAICLEPEQQITQASINELYDGSGPTVPTATIASELFGRRAKEMQVDSKSRCCHACRSSNVPAWTMVFDECGVPYCARCLWSRFGERLFDIKKTRDWKCPKCRGICNCLHCLKNWDRSKKLPFPVPSGDMVLLSEQPHYLEHRHGNVLASDKQCPSGPVFKNGLYLVEEPPAELQLKMRNLKRRIPEAERRPASSRKKSKTVDSARRISVSTPMARRSRPSPELDCLQVKRSFTDPSTESRHRGFDDVASWTPGESSSNGQLSHGTKSARPSNGAFKTRSVANGCEERVPWKDGNQIPRLQPHLDSRSPASVRQQLTEMHLDPAFLKEYFVESMAVVQERSSAWAGVHAETVYRQMMGQ